MRWVRIPAVGLAAVIFVSVPIGCSSPAPAPTDAAQPSPGGKSKAASPSAKSSAAPAPASEQDAGESPPAADLPALVAGFQSPYSVRVFETTEQFRNLPGDVRRSVLSELSAHENATVRHNAWRAFATWATREDVPALIAALASPHEDVRSAAITLLARFPNAQTLEVLTKALEDPLSRERAEELLVSVGPAAELPALAYIAHADAELRSAAWRILGRVGTRKSLLELGRMATQAQFQNSSELQAAMEQIRERLRR